MCLRAEFEQNACTLKPKPVSERSVVRKDAFESRILAERVYIAPNSVSERHNIANSVSESRILT